MTLPATLIEAIQRAAKVSTTLFATAALGACDRGPNATMAIVGEARAGAISIALPVPTRSVPITAARYPGRPLVVIDPGHGGRDPGASGVGGGTREKDVTLMFARELRDSLAKRGRVRIALTHDGDATLALDDRSAIARQLGAALFLSIHTDSAANPEARGATIYSLSDIASDADAARMAAAQDQAVAANGSAADGSVRAILADLATQDEMEASAQFANRLLRKAQGRIALRPNPHRFAAFRVLRRADAPAVLFEAGYLSNIEDEAMLTDPVQRARIIAALTEAVEAQLAIRR